MSVPPFWNLGLGTGIPSWPKKESPKRRVGSVLMDIDVFRSRTLKKSTIIVGLKSDNRSREVLLRLLTLVVKPWDNVLAIHVQDLKDTVDPNTFYIHEDLCKSKQVDFQVKVCMGDSYAAELIHQVRVNHATILAIGCSLQRPRNLIVSTFLKGLPPTCTLMVMNDGGKILLQKEGTSQQGNIKMAKSTSLLSPPMSPLFNPLISTRPSKKLVSQPFYSTLPSMIGTNKAGLHKFRRMVQIPGSMSQKMLQKLAPLEADGYTRCFTSQELKHATGNFSSKMLIGEGGNSKVYRASFDTGPAAVKVLRNSQRSVEDLVQEVEMLSSVKQENIVKLIGYCDDKGMHAIVYNLLKGSLKNNLRKLRWTERVKVAIGVGKALTYLHHSCNPPVIHRDVKSSNILLMDNCHPQLSDFGASVFHLQSHQTMGKKPFKVIGTFGYLAPEYVMHGKVDEKIDVYSYGVVLLELITGKDAIHKNQISHGSLVLWARSLLDCGMKECLVDPYLDGDYNKEEMETLMLVARLCLLHSSSRRPTMKTIMRLLEEPQYRLKMQKKRDEFLNDIGDEIEIEDV